LDVGVVLVDVGGTGRRVPGLEIVDVDVVELVVEFTGGVAVGVIVVVTEVCVDKVVNAGEGTASFRI
jgi:hypothetical protein